MVGGGLFEGRCDMQLVWMGAIGLGGGVSSWLGGRMLLSACRTNSAGPAPGYAWMVTRVMCRVVVGNRSVMAAHLMRDVPTLRGRPHWYYTAYPQINRRAGYENVFTTPVFFPSNYFSLSLSLSFFPSLQGISRANSSRLISKETGAARA